MVSTENNNGIFMQAAVFQDFQDSTDAIVNVADSAIICSPSSFDLIFREVDIPKVAYL